MYEPDGQWRTAAACIGRRTDIFFAPAGEDPDVIHPAAQRLCDRCPSFEPCLDYALRNGVSGTWAGTTERGRSRMRRERGIKAQPVTLPTFEPTTDMPEENIA